jgi:indolepyruvate ferredoxin oxidoreductase beta subunit
MQYIIVGIGGQGILFTSKALGHIAIGKGFPVIGSEVHGMAQRGGSVISHFKVGNYKSPLVTEGNADVVIAFDQNEGIRNLTFLKKGGTFLVNTGDDRAFQNESLKQYLADREIETCRFAGYDILNRHMGGNLLFLNVLILGAGSGMKIRGFEKDLAVAALEALSPAKYLEANLKVFELGIEAAG